MLNQQTTKLFLKALAPMLLLAVGIISSWLLNNHPPQAAKTEQVTEQEPLVQVTMVSPETLIIPVYSRGEVTPTHQVQLTLEVPGQVVQVSPHLVAGGFFNKGEVLLKVDDSRYRLDIVRSMAQVVSMRQAYQQIKEEMESAEEIPGLPSPRKYRAQKVEEALARLRAAEAEVQLARIQVEKTRLVAPFTGRVHTAIVGVGQYVSPGAQLAQIYPTDTLEVRLPLSEQQLAVLDLSSITGPEQHAPSVRLKLDFSGKTYFWQGRMVRTEAGVDARSQLLYAVTQIDQPYIRDPAQPDRPMLVVGQFLEAAIQGKTINQVIKVPRDALYNGDQVWIVEQGRLKRRMIQTAYKNRQWAYVQSGLTAGDRVVLSPAEFAIDGMKVKVNEQKPSPQETIKQAQETSE